MDVPVAAAAAGTFSGPAGASSGAVTSAGDETLTGGFTGGVFGFTDGAGIATLGAESVFPMEVGAIWETGGPTDPPAAPSPPADAGLDGATDGWGVSGGTEGAAGS